MDSSPLEASGVDEVARILKAGIDYYAILYVQRDADGELLKKNYRKLALAVHPDKNQDPQAEIAFKLLGEAFTCLSNPDLRKRYDVSGEIDENARRQAEEFSVEMKIRLAQELYRQLTSLFSSINASLSSSTPPPPSHPHFGSVTNYQRSQPPAFGSVTGYTTQKPPEFGSVTGYQRSQPPTFGSVTSPQQRQPPQFGSVTNYQYQKPPEFGSVTGYNKK